MGSTIRRTDRIDLKDEVTTEPAADVDESKNDNLDWLFTQDEGTREGAGEDRTAYSLGGVSFTVPAAWKLDADNSNESQISFSMNENAISSMMRIGVQDMGENAAMLKMMDFDTVMDLLVSSLSNQFEGATAEPVTYGSIPGRKMAINMMGFDASVFLTFNDSAMVIVMAMDTSMDLAQLEQAVAGVVETMSWAE